MSSPDPNIKQIRLVTGPVSTGAADEDPTLQEGGATGQTRKRGGGGRRGAQKTYKIGSITKEGGGSTSPGTMTQLAASHVPGGATAVATAVGVDSALTQKGAPVQAASVGGGENGSRSPVKVILAAPKKKAKAVVLAAPTPKVPTATAAAGVAAASAAAATTAAAAAAAKTRKHKRSSGSGAAARKIRVSVSSLSKKIHRAKTIRNKAKEDGLAEVKKTLHKAGLIKADSKAPEAVLRQMYADFLTLKGRAL